MRNLQISNSCLAGRQVKFQLLFLASSLYLLASAPLAHAASPTPACQIRYGGGLESGCRALSRLPSPLPAKPQANLSPKAQIQTQNPTQTKGGQAVYPAPSINTTPSTGPEALILFALGPIGALGVFLKKKATHPIGLV